MKMMVVSPSLALGGIERVAADISRCWIEQGHDVTMLTLQGESADFYRLHPRVERVALGHNGLRQTAYQLFLQICACRGVIRRVDPQVVLGLGCACGTLVVMAAMWLPCRTVICEFGVPGRNPMSRGREWLRRKAYCLADAVTSENKAVSDWLKKHTWARRTVVIPKSIQWPLSTAERAMLPDIVCKPGRQIILAAGRLVPVKGFDALLRAFAVAVESRPEWDLVILGEGTYRRELELQVTSLGLEGRVFLPGSAGNPGAWYQRASIFAVSSLHEGGPNTLIEALAYGLPAVSFDCDEGPRTIIRNNVDGILVPPRDENSFADSLRRLMDDTAVRAHMAARAVEARDRFSEENCMQHWGKLLQTIGIV